MITHNKLEGTGAFTSASWCLATARTLAVVGVAIGVLGTLSLARAQGDIESLLPGIVKIVASGAGTKTGTGFVVARTKSDTYIVTAAHVVEGADRISVFFYDRPSKAVGGTASRIQASDPRGLALVTVSEAVSSSVTPLALASDVRMSRGEAVKGVGHQASHGDWGVISGDVASREGSLIRIQAPVEQQTSGGPVIRDGRVVGMFVSQQPNVGIAITALAVRDYLDGALPPGVQPGATAISEKPPKSGTTEKPATPEKPPAADTRRIVISGPKPLYAPFKTGDVFQECAECPEMVVIVPDPKGFTIGSPEREQGRQADEKQFGPIQFAKPYAIGKFEVTRAQFKASGVRPSGNCYMWDDKNSKWQLDPKRNWEQPGFDQGPDHPVVCVNWDEVQEYLKWINRQVGASGKDAYRLPSEAEWEYAARGGTTTARFWGNEADQACGYANVADRTLKQAMPSWPFAVHECRDGFVNTAPVGRFKPNAFGLCDMIGNVWEWVQDCYAEQYSTGIRDGSAFETQNCGQRVVRGGSWNLNPELARVAYRSGLEPSYRDDNLGFRLARTL